MMELKRGRVVHALPGRVRIRLRREELTDEFVRELRSALTSLSGVYDVETTPRTGSVVIHYDPAELDAAGLINLARTANLLALDPLPGDDESFANSQAAGTPAERVVRTFREVDARLAEVTQGRWDLRSLVPAALGLLALRQMVRSFGELGAAPWYVLAWYAFDSFWKLNQERNSAEHRPQQLIAQRDD
jgi:hypothetical protein